jgi:hypothetical protein
MYYFCNTMAVDLPRSDGQRIEKWCISEKWMNWRMRKKVVIVKILKLRETIGMTNKSETGEAG